MGRVSGTLGQRGNLICVIVLHSAWGIEGKTVDIFAKIAEERIRQAMEDGEFASLPGSGKPLMLEDETWIPEDMRLSYRVLKNAGCIPPELEKRKEILNLKELLNTIDDDKERLRKLRELNFKLMEFNIIKGRPLYLETFPDYEQRIFEKITNS